MNKFIITIILLACSNVFMSFAWYGHLDGVFLVACRIFHV